MRFFRGADCNTDHYLLVANDRVRLPGSKQATQKFHVERFIITKLNEVDVRKKYQIKISNRQAALEKS